MGCKKCNFTGLVPGESKKETIVNGLEFEYPTMRYCECEKAKKEKQLKEKIANKPSWVDKYLPQETGNVKS